MKISSWKKCKAILKILFAFVAAIGLGFSFWYEGKIPCPVEFVLELWMIRIVLFACVILYAVSLVKGIRQEKTTELDTLGWLLGSACIALMAWLQDVEGMAWGLIAVGVAVFAIGLFTVAWDIWRF